MAIFFNSSQRINLPTGATAVGTSDDVTIAALVERPELGNWRGIYCEGSYGDGYGIQTYVHQSDNDFVFAGFNTSGEYKSSSSGVTCAIDTEYLYAVCVRRIGSDWYVDHYIYNVSTEALTHVGDVIVGAGTPRWSSATRMPVIGAAWESADPWYGPISWVYVAQRDLSSGGAASPTDILELIADGAWALNDSDCHLFAPLTDPLDDRSSNNFTLTPAETPSFVTGHPTENEPAGGITATSSTTQAADTGSATGGLSIAGASTTTQAGDTNTGAADLSITATASTTQAGDTGSATATLALAADATTTQAGDSGEATAALAIAATSTTAQAADTLVATGTLAIEATATSTQAGDTGTATATTTGETGMVGDTTQAGDTGTATAQLSITATADTTQAGDVGTATATLLLLSASDVVQAGDVGTATGALAIVASATTTQAGDTGSATAITTTPSAARRILIGTASAGVFVTTASAGPRIVVE